MTVKWWYTETAADLPVIARSIAPAQLDTQGTFHHFVKHGRQMSQVGSRLQDSANQMADWFSLDVPAVAAETDPSFLFVLC